MYQVKALCINGCVIFTVSNCHECFPCHEDLQNCKDYLCFISVLLFSQSEARKFIKKSLPLGFTVLSVNWLKLHILKFPFTFSWLYFCAFHVSYFMYVKFVLKKKTKNIKKHTHHIFLLNRGICVSPAIYWLKFLDWFDFPLIKLTLGTNVTWP